MSVRRGTTPKKKGSRRDAAARPAEWDPPAGHGPGQDRSVSRASVRELTWSHFDALIGELARGVRKSARPQAVVGVAHGGVFVGGAIARALGCDFFPVRITRRSRDTGVRRAPKITGKMPTELKGRRVLIVDDVAASGDTLELARNLVTKAGARQVLTAVLLRRTTGYSPDWSALTTDELVVFPWDYQPLVEDGRFEVESEG